MEPETYDVVVVGGGAAGLSAALVLGRARRRVAVVDAGTPRNAPAAHMHGFLSRDGMPPAELLAAGRDEVTRLRRRARSTTGSSRSSAGFACRPRERRGACRHGGSWSRPAPTTSCPTSPAPASAGAATSCTARTATAGRCATSRSACSGPAPAPSSTRTCSGSGRTTSSSSRTRYAVTADGARSAGSARHPRRRRATSRGSSSSTIDSTRCELARRSDAFRAPRSSSGPALRAHATACSQSSAARSTRRASSASTPPAGRASPGVWAAGNAANPRAQVITAAGEGSAAAIAINADLVAEDVRNALSRDADRATVARSKGVQ